MCSIPSMFQLWSTDGHECSESLLQNDATDNSNRATDRKLEGVENVRLNIARASLNPVKWRRTGHRLLNHIMRHQSEVSWFQTIEAVQVILNSWRTFKWDDIRIHSCVEDACIELGKGYSFPDVGEIMARTCIEKMLYFAFIDVCVNFDMLMLIHKLLMNSGDMSMVGVVMMYDVSEIFVLWPPTSLEKKLNMMSFPLYFMSHDLHVSRGQMRVGQLLCPAVVPAPTESQHESFGTKAPLVACLDVIYDSMALLPSASRTDGRWAHVRPPRQCVAAVWTLCLGNDDAVRAVKSCLASYEDIVLDLLPYVCVSRCFKASSGMDTTFALALTVLQTLQRYPHGYEKSCISWFHGFVKLLNHDPRFGDLHNALFVSEVGEHQGSSLNTLVTFYMSWLATEEFVPTYPKPALVRNCIDDVLLMAAEEPGIMNLIFNNAPFMVNEVVIFHYFMYDVVASDLILTWHRLGFPGTSRLPATPADTEGLLTRVFSANACVLRVCRYNRALGVPARGVHDLDHDSGTVRRIEVVEQFDGGSF